MLPVNHSSAINSDHAYVVLIDFLTGQINVTMLFGLFSNDVSYKFGASGYSCMRSQEATGKVYLPSRGANPFCSQIVGWMSNIIILDVVRPNFS